MGTETEALRNMRAGEAQPRYSPGPLQSGKKHIFEKKKKVYIKKEGSIYFIKKEGLEKEKHIFEKKKKVYIKKKEVYILEKKEGSTYKKRRKYIFFILK